MLQIGSRGHVDWHNEAAAQLLGRAGQSLRQLRVSDLLPAEALQREARSLRVCGGDGQSRTLHVCPVPGTRELFLLRPVLAEAERYQRSQYFARIGTWDWDIDTNRLYWSEAIYGMFGYRVGEVTPSYELFCQSVHPDDREQVRAGEQRCIETGENHDEEYRVIWPDGSIHWLRETGNIVKDEHGIPVKMMGVVRDITEEKAWASQMHRLAHHDPLTGLPNRLVFEEQLDRALERARRAGTRIALVFIDLNDFKAINDRLGHAAGDQVLQQMARRLRDALRGSDSVARLGGDEFVAILETLSLERSPEEEARAVAGKLLAALTQPVKLEGSVQPVGASLGIAFFPDHAHSRDRLIHVADLAMYEAKRSGDNQYRLAQAASQD
ncbi:PAS domain S-box-containing protein/diguanylate cyclase (GGDEF) domain-containing protein [Aquipseudomonas alcaligenes]|uniref:PAS domain S-box-containing protein/diguanylate cyclase (GGDEF) domain-containing protein n=1 Tax=Aquipseudomonas alcaligenes TaxID=43263 RepID=A0A1N6WJC3_AQUAC|nr:PAS domain S-box-containing protein/diguanylate cyclase (GGDEF) domain-containing protein [Pseudomonas alcaligenes]